MSHKILPLFIFFSLIFSKSHAQDFLGLSTGNFSGISGVMSQPASIVDSRFKFDLNLFSTNVNYSNNYFLLDKNVLLKFNKNGFSDYATFKDRYISEASLGAGEKVYFNISNRTQLPLSFMASTGKKSAIALNMQFRTMIQGRGISQDLANLAYNDFYHTPLTNTQIDVSGVNLNSLSWGEIGFTYGRVLYSSGKHFLKGAITGKYLAGLSSINLASGDLQMQVNSDSTFNFKTTDVSYNHNKNADFNNLFEKNFRPNANAFGLDAGLVYEYRGNIDKFKYLKSDDETSYDVLRRDVNKYIFKLGVSLLDVGMFTFDKPDIVNSFSANINNWDIRNAQFNSIRDFDTALANRVVPNPNDPRSYHVYLPTALSGQLDVKFVKGLFLNIMSYWPVNIGDKPGERFDKFGYYTITPRFETRHFGIYIPYTVTQRNDFTDYKQQMLGATVRLGPLFIGSSNLGSMLFNSKLKSADIHIGLKVGFTYGKPNKSNQILHTVFSEGKVSDTSSYEIAKEKMSTGVNTKTNQNGNNVILDYKAGKVYDNPGVKQNITIINNYYYGLNPAERVTDSISLQHTYPGYYSDSLQTEMIKIAGQRNQVIADSMSKITTDSLKVKRQQLDSLIKSMQKLQKQMDSTTRTQANTESDSAISYNEMMNSRRKNLDRVRFEKDSLQGRREALMTTATTIRPDTTRAFLSGQIDQFPVDKKKVKPVQDSGLIKSNSETRMAVRESLKADSADMQIKKENDFTRKLQQMQDSLDRFSKISSDMSDSLTRERSLVQAQSNNTVLSSQEKNAMAPASMQESKNIPDTKESERLQQKQNELLRQYARQADMLSKDIDRLNSRVVAERRNNRRNNNYIPVPIPVNNSRNMQREAPVASALPPVRDTVYIRDTLMRNDSILKSDSVNNSLSDSFSSRRVPVVTKIDTVLVKEVVKEPGFDFATLPEENILFGLGKKSLQPIYDHRLDFIAGILKNNPDLKVRISGHTDSSGSKEVNERLSLQRAQTVAEYLITKGVFENQIIVHSQSFTDPAVSGNSAAARSQNRRVSVKLEKNGQ